MSIGTANSFDYDLILLYNNKIDGTDYDPTLPVPLAGNVAGLPHWTVFRFHLADLTASGSGIYPITVTADKTGAGQGHWLTGVSMVVTVPKASATVTKTWIGGPMNPIQIQLQKQSATTPLQNHGLPVTLTASGGTATYTWNDLPYTDSLGSILTYSIIEPSGGSGYTVQFFNDGYNETTRHYTWRLVNTYSATGSVTLSASKHLDGRTLAAGEFSFQLKEGATVLQTKTNAANGSIAFDAINYTLANVGLHTYTITELPSALGGITIDPMVLTVTVNVVDNGDGTLTATPSYPADVTFNNTYAASGSVSLAASKQLSGRTLAAGDFSFQLKEGATVLQTKTNAADGSITFDAINYTQADKGLHTYTITEMSSALGGISIDPMVLTVTVNVVDKGDGTLTATTTYPSDTIFNNTYAQQAASHLLPANSLAAGHWQPENSASS